MAGLLTLITLLALRLWLLRVPPCFSATPQAYFDNGQCTLGDDLLTIFGIHSMPLPSAPCVNRLGMPNWGWSYSHHWILWLWLTLSRNLLPSCPASSRTVHVQSYVGYPMVTGRQRECIKPSQVESKISGYKRISFLFADKSTNLFQCVGTYTLCVYSNSSLVSA